MYEHYDFGESALSRLYVDYMKKNRWSPMKHILDKALNIVYRLVFTNMPKKLV